MIRLILDPLFITIRETNLEQFLWFGNGKTCYKRNLSMYLSTYTFDSNMLQLWSLLRLWLKKCVCRHMEVTSSNAHMLTQKLQYSHLCEVWGREGDKAKGCSTYSRQLMVEPRWGKRETRKQKHYPKTLANSGSQDRHCQLFKNSSLCK